MKNQNKARITPYRIILCQALLACAALVLLLAPGTAHGACACASGQMTNYYPGVAPVTINGDMSEWASITANVNNNICDAPPGTEGDGKIQSTGRDLTQFSYTYDSNYVYAYTVRVGSDNNTDNFIYYADTNNNGLMETGEKVIVVGWSGSNRTVSVYIGDYQSYYPGGDPMVCTTGFTAGQTCTVGKADGYRLPGTIVNLPASGHPNYSGTWGSVVGTEMEWKVSWADLGMASTPGRAFTFHVSSTNSQPGSGSFPSQVDDNMGGCGGGGGSSQYAGVTITAGSTYVFPASLALNLRHTITNTGNGNDAFALGLATAAGLAPATVAFYQDNGSGQPTGPALTSTPTLAPSGTFAVVAVLTWTAGPGVNGPGTYTVTATSAYDYRSAASATDTVQAAPWITIAKQTTNSQYGSFGFCGTNGPPACASPVTVTTAAGSNPATVRYLAAVNTQTTVTEQTSPAGWDLAGIQCSDGTSSIGTVSGSTVTIPATSLIAGANLTCTFTNKKRATITVQKALAPTGDTFALKVGATTVVTGGDGASGSTTAAADTPVTISETAATGSLASYYTTYSCTDGTSGAGTSYALTPAAGANITCTFSNTKWATLIIKKSAPNGYNNTTFTYDVIGPNSFSASTTATINNSGSGTAATLQLPTSKTGQLTYDIVEEPKSGWNTTGISCTGAVSTATDPNNNRRIFINVNPGTAVTCTYTNAATSTPQVVIKNQSYGGTGAFSYSGGTNGIVTPLTLNTANGNPDTSSTYAITTAGSSAAITETLQAGWTLTGIDCRDGGNNPIANSSTWLNTATGVLTIPGTALPIGAFVACTFQNNKNPTVTLKKQSNGGAGSFTLSGGTNGLPANLTLDTTATNPATSSSYMVTTIGQAASIAETVPSNWALTGAVCVDGSNTVVSNGTWLSVSGATGTLTIPGTALAAGVNLTCTFTNTLLLPNLTVLKYAFGVTSGATAKPGQEIPYMITVSNTGPGIAGNVVVQDCLSPYSAWTLNTFTFADGVAPSGPSGLSLTGSTMYYSYDYGSTWTTTSPANDGTGHAPTVNCWKLVMDPAKSMNANPSSFTLNYQAIVK